MSLIIGVRNSTDEDTMMERALDFLDVFDGFDGEKKKRGIDFFSPANIIKHKYGS